MFISVSLSQYQRNISSVQELATLEHEVACALSNYKGVRTFFPKFGWQFGLFSSAVLKDLMAVPWLGSASLPCLVTLFDMPNSNRFNILLISIFSEISLSISIFSRTALLITISIFSRIALSIFYRLAISIFSKFADINIQYSIHKSGEKTPK